MAYLMVLLLATKVSKSFDGNAKTVHYFVRIVMPFGGKVPWA
jgi:hypothetical protein